MNSRPLLNYPLQGLRGLLASFVVAYHVYEMGVKKGLYHHIAWGVLDRFGPYAVSLFFCVSGFLIIQSLLGKSSLKSFFINRALRLYPVFLTLHLLIFSLGPLMGYSWMSELRTRPLAWTSAFISNALFLPGLFDLPIAQQNAWSLSYEAAFYLISAGLYAAVRSSGFRSKARLALWCGVGAVMIWFRPLSVFFLIGVAVLWASRKGYQPRFKGAGLAGAAALILGLLTFPYSLPAAVICSTLFFAAVVYGCGVVGEALSTRPMQWLGNVSYSLYLVHPFALEMVRGIALRLKRHGHAHSGELLFALLGPVLALAATALMFELVERRLTNWIKRSMRSRQANPGHGQPLLATELTGIEAASRIGSPVHQVESF